MFTCPGSHNPVMELQFVAKQLDFRDRALTPNPSLQSDWEGHRARVQKNEAARGVMNCARGGPGAPHTGNVCSSFEVQTTVGRVVCTCVCVCMHTMWTGAGKEEAFQGLKKEKKKPQKYVHLRDCK